MGNGRTGDPALTTTTRTVVGTSTSESLSLLDILKPHTREMLVPLTRHSPPSPRCAVTRALGAPAVRQNSTLGWLLWGSTLRRPRVTFHTKPRTHERGRDQRSRKDRFVCVSVCVTL